LGLLGVEEAFEAFHGAGELGPACPGDDDRETAIKSTAA